MKIIKITNEPSFHKGVESYVIDCDVKDGSFECAPNLKKAMKFKDIPSLGKIASLIKESFKEVTVQIINVD